MYIKYQKTIVWSSVLEDVVLLESKNSKQSFSRKWVYMRFVSLFFGSFFLRTSSSESVDGFRYCTWRYAQLWTCGRTSQDGILHRRSTEVTSCTGENFGVNCNLFWCIRYFSLLCLYQYGLRTLLHLTLEHIFEKSVDSVDLTDPHVSSERQLWESMICKTISRPVSQKSADFTVSLGSPESFCYVLSLFPPGSADLDSGVSTSSLLCIERHAIPDCSFQKSADFADPDSCVVSFSMTSFSKDKTLFSKRAPWIIVFIFKMSFYKIVWGTDIFK